MSNPVENRVRPARVLSLAFMLPYSGVDHAGGQYLLHHYRVLAERSCRLDAFASELGSNKLAATRQRDVGVDTYHATVLDFPRWRKTIIGRVLARLFHIAFPVLPDLGAVIAFKSSTALRERVREAEIIELQWFEYFYFARLATALNPGAKVIGVAHDIPSQRIERSLSGWPDAVRRIVVAYVEQLQRWILSGIPTLAAHSQKDVDLLRQLAPSSSVSVLNPPMELDWPSSPSEITGRQPSTARSFGFVGALHRRENDDAAQWLLTDIWPRVLKDCADARLYIVGSTPSAELQDLAAKFANSVHVTGYVENLDEYYDLFDTTVLPLRFGAGIKLKTVSAILAGKNVVATPIAVEGTLPDDCFFCVSDSADALGGAMVALAQSPAIGRATAEKAKHAAGSRYSRESYVRSVAEVYGL